MKVKVNVLKLGFVLAMIATVSACSHKKPKPDEEKTVIGGYDVGPIKESDIFSSDKGNAGGLQTAHFAFNDYSIDKANREILIADAKVLKSNRTMNVQIEGHCDQRGGIQYNLALGEKRANAVRKFLILNGISKDRITTISFGKEKLIDTADTEEAYAKNRRANFVITAK